jgi:hypothetical protein
MGLPMADLNVFARAEKAPQRTAHLTGYMITDIISRLLLACRQGKVRETKWRKPLHHVG